MFVNTNFLPQINDTTIFSSGRVRVIPFERHFEEHEQNKHLKGILAKPENLSGILNWCIDGWHMLKSDGFNIPESVRLATDSYHHSSDKIGLFIEDSLIQDPKGEVRTAEVYAAYKQWCFENGYKTENVKNFNAALGTTMTIEHRRPRTGGGATTLITGYKMLSAYDKIVPL